MVIFRKGLLLLCFLCAHQAFASEGNSLTLYFYHSPRKLNWKSPGQLTRSVVASVALDELNGHDGIALGHVSVEVKCSDSWRFHSGMTQSNPTESMGLLLGKRIGLGILFHSFKGRFETEKEVEDRLKKKKIKYNYVDFSISNSTCLRLKEYIEVFKEEKLDKYYGLSLDPRKREGAGCAPFAISFLELIGVLSPETSHPDLREEIESNWMKTLVIPQRYLSDPENNRKVSFLKLLMGKTNWELGKSDAGRELSFGDPNSMFSWVKENANETRTIYNRQIEGVKIDLSKLSTPLEPIFRK